jgi:hypothetical protein
MLTQRGNRAGHMAGILFLITACEFMIIPNLKV